MTSVEGETLIWGNLGFLFFGFLDVRRFLGLRSLFRRRLNKIGNFLKNVNPKIVKVFRFLKVVEVLDDELLSGSIAHF